MAREVTNVASETKRPRILIVFAAERGNSASKNAAAMGSQIVQLRMWVIGAPHLALRATLSPLRGATDTRDHGAGEGSHEDPYEYDHSHKKHQRVVAYVARLQEAQQVAHRGDDVSAESENAVDQRIDAAPEEP